MPDTTVELFPLIDWLSFTVDSPMHRRTKELQWLDPLNKTLCRRQALTQVARKIGHDCMNTLFSQLPPDLETARFPYQYLIVDNESTARISYSSQLPHIAVEISGKGMSLLHEKGLVDSISVCVSSSCSRIDVSVDFATDLSPTEFVGAGYNVRMLSSMTVTSPTGVTEYVGSPQSQKRAAVYRYAPPHPRSGYLRVEHRYRHTAARAMCNYVAVNGLAMAAQYAGLEFNWQSQIWDLDGIKVIDLPNLAGDCRDPNFAQWLLRQVFPAMRRAQRTGRIDDLQAFVQVHLFDDINHSIDEVDHEGVAFSG